MNADDLKRLLEGSLHEGGMANAADPDTTSIAGRVRGARRRRAAGSAVAGVATIALIAAVVWQVGGFSNEPNPPATPTQTSASDAPTTDPTSEPSGEPTADATGEPTGTDPGDWSDGVFPECGDTFDGLPERTSQLVVTEGPSEPLGPGGSWLSQVENTGSTWVQGDVAFYQTVVVDAEGVVVATIETGDEIFWGAEGSTHLAIAPGETLPFQVSESWTCGTDTPEQLGSGAYEVYVLLSISEEGVADPVELEQAQGGPFPMVIGDGVEPQPTSLAPPQGAQPWDRRCGDSWTTPEPDTGFELELLDQINTRRPVTDDIDGRSRLSVTQQVSGAIYHEVVLIQDGRILSSDQNTDAVTTYVLSAGSDIEPDFGRDLLGCDGAPLASGEYQTVVITLLQQFSSESDDGVTRYVVAATDPVDLVIE